MTKTCVGTFFVHSQDLDGANILWGHCSFLYALVRSLLVLFLEDRALRFASSISHYTKPARTHSLNFSLMIN